MEPLTFDVSSWSDKETLFTSMMIAGAVLAVVGLILFVVYKSGKTTLSDSDYNLGAFGILGLIIGLVAAGGGFFLGNSNKEAAISATYEEFGVVGESGAIERNIFEDPSSALINGISIKSPEGETVKYESASVTVQDGIITLNLLTPAK